MPNRSIKTLIAVLRSACVGIAGVVGAMLLWTLAVLFWAAKPLAMSPHPDSERGGEVGVDLITLAHNLPAGAKVAAIVAFGWLWSRSPVLRQIAAPHLGQVSPQDKCPLRVDFEQVLRRPSEPARLIRTQEVKSSKPSKRKFKGADSSRPRPRNAALPAELEARKLLRHEDRAAQVCVCEAENKNGRSLKTYSSEVSAAREPLTSFLSSGAACAWRPGLWPPGPPTRLGPHPRAS